MGSAGDLSGKRYRLGIEYEAGKQIVFSVDGEQVATVTQPTQPAVRSGKPMKPYLDLQLAPVDHGSGWASRWE